MQSRLAEYELIYRRKPQKAQLIVGSLMVKDARTELPDGYKKYEKNLSFEMCDEKGRNLFQEAADSGCYEFFTLATENCSPEERLRRLHSFNTAGLATIHYAAKEGTELGAINTILALLKLGADINLPTNDANKFPAFYYAIQRKIPSLVLFFLEHTKAEYLTPIPGLGGKSLLHFACDIDPDKDPEAHNIMFIMLDIAKKQLQGEPGDKLIHILAALGELKAVEQLLKLTKKQGGDAAVKELLNSKNDAGETPLHKASKYLNSQMATLLIKWGADLKARDKQGFMPIFYSLQKKKEAAELGATIILNSPNRNLSTVYSNCRGLNLPEEQDPCYLKLMAMDSHVDVFKVLSRSDLASFQTADGQHLIHFAAWGASTRTPNTENIAYFNQVVGLNINMKTETLGYTPLHSAMHKAPLETIRFMIEQLGADPTIPDKTGRKPLDWLNETNNQNPHKEEIRSYLKLKMQEKTGAAYWEKGPVSYPPAKPVAKQPVTSPSSNNNYTSKSLYNP